MYQKTINLSTNNKAGMKMEMLSVFISQLTNLQDDSPMSVYNISFAIYTLHVLNTLVIIFSFFIALILYFKQKILQPKKWTFSFLWPQKQVKNKLYEQKNWIKMFVPKKTPKSISYEHDCLLYYMLGDV